MKISAHRWLFSPTLIALVLASQTLAMEPLSLEQFQQVRAIIKPAATEDKWAQIPWQIDLWEARKKAATEGKPILLWEMDGHPLACV
jgi:hypothetical protein